MKGYKREYTVYGALEAVANDKRVYAFYVNEAGRPEVRSMETMTAYQIAHLDSDAEFYVKDEDPKLTMNGEEVADVFDD